MFLCVPVASLPCQPTSLGATWAPPWLSSSHGEPAHHRFFAGLVGPDFSQGQMTPCSVSVACSASPSFGLSCFAVSLLSPSGCPWAPTASSLPLSYVLWISWGPIHAGKLSHLGLLPHPPVYLITKFGEFHFSPDGCSGWSPYGFFDAEKAS